MIFRHPTIKKVSLPPAQNAHHSDVEKGNPFCYCATNRNLNAWEPLALRKLTVSIINHSLPNVNTLKYGTIK